MDTHLQLSEDGSHTIFSDKYQAHYHSIQGALLESIHIFISAGIFHLYRKGIKEFHIFEMGFGTGLNAILSLLESERFDLNIEYTTIESDPISIEVVNKLNYHELLKLNITHQNNFLRLHALPWNKKTQITDRFTFMKLKSQIENHSFKNDLNLIFYDAFSPSSQPHLWEKNIHEKIYNALMPGSVLVTYCTQGAFRRMLLSLGYKIEKLNGPGNKREMLRATKPN